MADTITLGRSEGTRAVIITSNQLQKIFSFNFFPSIHPSIYNDAMPLRQPTIKHIFSLRSTYPVSKRFSMKSLVSINFTKYSVVVLPRRPQKRIKNKLIWSHGRISPSDVRNKQIQPHSFSSPKVPSNAEFLESDDHVASRGLPRLPPGEAMSELRVGEFVESSRGGDGEVAPHVLR